MKQDLVLIQGTQQTLWSKNYSFSLSGKNILSAFYLGNHVLKDFKIMVLK